MRHLSALVVLADGGVAPAKPESLLTAHQLYGPRGQWSPRL